MNLNTHVHTFWLADAPQQGNRARHSDTAANVTAAAGNGPKLQHKKDICVDYAPVLGKYEPI